MASEVFAFQLFEVLQTYSPSNQRFTSHQVTPPEVCQKVHPYPLLQDWKRRAIRTREAKSISHC